VNKAASRFLKNIRLPNFERWFSSCRFVLATIPVFFPIFSFDMGRFWKLEKFAECFWKNGPPIGTFYSRKAWRLFLWPCERFFGL